MPEEPYALQYNIPDSPVPLSVHKTAAFSIPLAITCNAIIQLLLHRAAEVTCKL